MGARRKPEVISLGEELRQRTSIRELYLHYQQQRIPNSSLVIIEGTGHGAMWQVPNEFTAYIQNFLETTK
jgi:pimeloyl-ACP methyl ester carboxylesterase